MSQEKEPLYSISVASKLVGVSPRVLRSYEEANLINPFRTHGQTRLFSNHDIQKIKLIHFLHREKEINLAGIKAIFALANTMLKNYPSEDVHSRKYHGAYHEKDEAVNETYYKIEEDRVLSKIEEIAPDL